MQTRESLPQDTRSHEQSPYVGPRPFTADDRDVFFGRNQEAIELTALIKAHPETLLYAQSGAGKTSLLFAQVIPTLDTEEEFDVLPPARVRSQESAAIPDEKITNIYMFNALKDLSDDQLSVVERSQFTLADYLQRRPRSALKMTAEEVAANSNQNPELRLPRVVVFDQFEEIFTLHPERYKDREDFFTQVGAALAADPFLRVVFSMREDYIAELVPYVDLLPQNLRTRFRLERLRKSNAVLAVTRPLETDRAKAAARTFAPGAAEMLIDKLMLIKVKAASGDKIEVPGEFVDPVQLQVVCQTLWQKLPPETRIITRENIDTYANVDEALSDFYENSVRKSVAVANRAVQAAHNLTSGDIPIVSEGSVRLWFDQKLITREGKRNMVFREAHSTAGLGNRVVDELENQHLIRVEMRGGEPWYELSHDRFIPPIRESNRRFLLQQPLAKRKAQELEERAAAWINSHRSEKLLLNRAELLDAQNWMHSDAASIGYSDALFSLIAASEAAIQHEDAQQQQALNDALQQKAIAEHQRARQFRLGLLVASVLLLFSLGSSIFAINRWRKANSAQATAWTEYDRARAALAAATSARTKETQQRRIAEEQRQKAEDAAKEASIAKQKAEDAASQLKIANQQEAAQTQAALTAQAKAEQAKELANQQKELAKQQKEVADSASKEAERNARDALAAKLATDSALQFSIDPELGLRLALMAVERSPIRYAQSTLRQAYDRFKDRAVFTGHTDVIHKAIYSPDGRFVFTASEDKTVKMWDVKSRHEIKTFEGHGGGVHALAVDSAGTRIATEAFDDTGRIWNIADRTSKVLADLTGPVAALAFSPDGKLLATEATTLPGKPGAAPRIWDAATGKILQTLTGHTDAVSALAFTPDGKKLVTASWDSTARIWDVASGRELVRLAGHTAPLASVAVSPSGEYVVTGSYDSTARLWETGTGKLVAILKGHTGVVHNVAFNPQGNLILTGGQRVRSTEAASDAEIPLPQDVKRDEDAPDDHSVRLYKLDGTQENVLEGHRGDISSATFGANGGMIVTASADGTVRVWDSESGEQIAIFSPPGGQGQNSAVLSPDNDFLLAAGADRTAEIWRIDSIFARAMWQAHKTQGFITSLLVHGQTLATSGQDGVRLWDVTSGASKPGGLSLEEANYTYASAISPSGDVVVTGSLGQQKSAEDFSAHVWDAKSQKPITALVGHKSAVIHIVYSPDGSFVATIDRQKTVKIWQTSDWRLVNSFPNAKQNAERSTIGISDVAFSRDGRLFAMAFRTGYVQVWDLAGNNPITTIQIHDGPIYSIAFNSEVSDPLLVTTGADKKARVCALSGKCLQTFQAPDGSLRTAELSHDGRLLLTVGSDGVARVWEMETGAQITQRSSKSESLTDATFTADATSLVLATESGRVILSDCDVCRPFNQIRNLALGLNPRELSADEMSQFLVIR
jgi:WD40 repeat protein